VYAVTEDGLMAILREMLRRTQAGVPVLLGYLDVANGRLLGNNSPEPYRASACGRSELKERLYI